MLSSNGFILNSFESFGFLTKTATTAVWHLSQFAVDSVFLSCLISSANLGESHFLFF